MPSTPTMPVFRANRVTHPAGAEVHLHTHHEGQLTLALDGTVRIQDHAGWHLATPGTAVWVPPRHEHAASYPKVCELIRMHLPAEDARALPDHCVLLPLSGLALELVKRTAWLGIADDRERDLIRELLVVQLEQYKAGSMLSIPDGSDKRVRSITRYLREHPASSESLAELAVRVGTSERTLARKFQEDTGLGFRQWRDRMRVVMAIEHMIQGEPLIAVALDVGYRSASSFSTAFARLMGVPPGEYLKELGL